MRNPTDDVAEHKEKYWVLLFDGSCHQHGMHATQLNELVTSQNLQKGSIVQLTEFVCNTIREHLYVLYLFSFLICLCAMNFVQIQMALQFMTWHDVFLPALLALHNNSEHTPRKIL